MLISRAEKERHGCSNEQMRRHHPQMHPGSDRLVTHCYVPLHSVGIIGFFRLNFYLGEKNTSVSVYDMENGSA